MSTRAVGSRSAPRATRARRGRAAAVAVFSAAIGCRGPQTIASYLACDADGGGPCWERFPYPDREYCDEPDVTSVVVAGADDVWVVSWFQVLRWDGRAWHSVGPDASRNETYAGLWAGASGDVWLVGQGPAMRANRDGYTVSTEFPAVWHREGEGWASVHGPWESECAAPHSCMVGRYGVWGRDAGDVWIFASRDERLTGWHFDGASWTSHPDVFPSIDVDALVGELMDAGSVASAALRDWVATPRAVVPVAAAAAITAGRLWLVDAREPWLAAEKVYRLDAGAWTDTRAPAVADDGQPIRYVTGWAAGSRDVWAVGTHEGHRGEQRTCSRRSTSSWDAAATSVLAHWDGQAWTTREVLVNDAGRLRRIAGSDARNVWAVGERGAILRRRP